VVNLDVPTLRETLARDGVVQLKGIFEPEWVDLLAVGIQRNLGTPGPYFRTLYAGTDREMLTDHSNFRCIPEYQILLRDSPIVDTVAGVLQTENLWLFFDQIWVKEPGAERRTPWHQDATSWVAAGEHRCGFWMSIDPLEAHESLEFVRGSHKGPIHAGTALEYGNDTKPYYPDSDWPPLPDIESDRASFDIVSFNHEPGDAILFHPATLHGGGAGGGRRRTLSLRFFGDKSYYEPRPGVPSPQVPGVAATHKSGDPLRSAWFPKVLPKPDQGRW
jgi:ectoine hydroxylase-related dioxygenase (phytanoyl-CoA dioxygenase family)